MSHTAPQLTTLLLLCVNVIGGGEITIQPETQILSPEMSATVFCFCSTCNHLSVHVNGERIGNPDSEPNFTYNEINGNYTFTFLMVTVNKTVYCSDSAVRSKMAMIVIAG